MSTQTQVKTLPFIDGLRGISILLVLFIHLTYYVSFDNHYTFKSSFNIFWTATYGVRLFFILSAYTLFRSYSIRRQSELNPVRNFYIRRAFRILPLFWSWILVYWIWDNGFRHPKSVFATAFFGMVFFRGGDEYPEIWAGAWSLYVEESFYAFFPLIYRFTNSLLKSLVWLCLSLAAAYLWEYSIDIFHLHTGADFVNLFPLNNFFCFFIGISIYHLEKDGYVAKLNRFTELHPRVVDTLILMALLVLMPKGHRPATLAFTLVFLSSFSERTLFGKITRLPFIKKAGVACYSIYLMNQFLLDKTQPVFGTLSAFLHLPNSVELRTVFWIPFLSLSLVWLGNLSFIYLEKPCISAGKKLIGVRMAPCG